MKCGTSKSGFLHSNSLKYSTAAYEEQGSHVTQFKGRSTNRGQLIKLNFFHLLQILIVFFITVYGKIPNLLIAMVSSGFIKLFGFALH